MAMATNEYKRDFADVVRNNVIYFSKFADMITRYLNEVDTYSNIRHFINTLRHKGTNYDHIANQRWFKRSSMSYNLKKAIVKATICQIIAEDIIEHRDYKQFATKNEVEELRVVVQEYEQKVCDLEIEIVELRDENDALSSRLEVTNDSVASLKEELITSNNTTSAVMEQLQNLIAKHEAVTANHEAVISNNKEIIADNVRIIAKHEAVIADHGEYIATLQREHKEECARLHARIDELENRVAELETRIGGRLPSLETAFEDRSFAMNEVRFLDESTIELCESFEEAPCFEVLESLATALSGWEMLSAFLFQLRSFICVAFLEDQVDMSHGLLERRIFKYREIVDPILK